MRSMSIHVNVGVPVQDTAHQQEPMVCKIVTGLFMLKDWEKGVLGTNV